MAGFSTWPGSVPHFHEAPAGSLMGADMEGGVGWHQGARAWAPLVSPERTDPTPIYRSPGTGTLSIWTAIRTDGKPEACLRLSATRILGFFWNLRTEEENKIGNTIVRDCLVILVSGTSDQAA